MNRILSIICLTLALTTVGANAAVYGDVNGDQEVNIADVNAVIDMILTANDELAGDVNNDGEINIADVNSVIEVILGLHEDPVYDGPVVGGDISMLTKYEAHQRMALRYGITNAHYYDLNGAVIDDVITWTKQQGWNAARVRLFVNPKKQNPDGDPDAQVCQNLDYVVRFCKRLKAEGFAVMLDFHYSDTWADPSNQWIPASWANLNEDELKTRIY